MWYSVHKVGEHRMQDGVVVLLVGELLREVCNGGVQNGWWSEHGD
jgi:hypothetical protein